MDVMGLTYMRYKAVTGSSVASPCRHAGFTSVPCPEPRGLGFRGSLDRPEAEQRPMRAFRPAFNLETCSLLYSGKDKILMYCVGLRSGEVIRICAQVKYCPGWTWDPGVRESTSLRGKKF